MNSDEIRSWVASAIREADQHEERGDYGGAVDILCRAIDLDPGNPRLRALRGRCYYVIEEWQDALSDFDSALAIEPNASTTLFFRARTKAMMGRLSGALRDFEECFAMDSDPDSMYEIALIHQFRGNVSGAIVALERCKEASGGEYRDAGERISELR